jgi:hypothetical protein
MPTAAYGPGLIDPAGLNPAVGRMLTGSRKTGRAALAVLTTALDDGEKVQIVAQGRYLGANGILALTDRRLLVVNDREWQPDITTVDLAPGLEVKGWQDERRAALVFERDGHQLVTDQIADRELAQEIAREVRARAGG